ncbi:MAG: ATP synthase F1 subunit delta [Rubrivivax sp.]|nr:ATP synthase F1 subunit delta [Rubrivivax sp.]
MREQVVAKRYAKALLLIGKEQGVLQTIKEDLTKIVALYEDHETFRRVMCDPVYVREKRKSILEEVSNRLGISPLCKRFLYLLVDKERIRYIPAILEAYTRLEDESAGRVRARIESAYALEEDDVETLRRALERRLAKEVILELDTVPELIGGIVCRVDGMVFDGSVRTQVETLKSTLRGE